MNNPVPASNGEALTASIAIWQSEKNRSVVEKTSRLIDKTNAFLDAEMDDRSAWQTAWLEAHDMWLAASILRKPDESALKDIDAWPLEPGFLDSLPDYPTTGIVNDVTLALKSDVIRQQNQYTDDVEVSLGFHVIEYYAFSRDPDDMLLADRHNSERRRLMIRLIAGLLMLDLLNFSSSPAIQPSSPLELLTRLHQRSQAIFSELNRLGEHSQSSGKSLHNVTVQLAAIEALLQDPVSLNHYLIELDPGKTETLNSSLKEAIALSRDIGNDDQSSVSRVLLLISAVSHQFEDLITLGKGEL
ncbi:MAG: hypothetical protein HOE54_05590 [Gammaproteobacteria bacterium]|nr:hypothetical protein [Gammaproteobacteria bacterium]